MSYVFLSAEWAVHWEGDVSDRLGESQLPKALLLARDTAVSGGTSSGCGRERHGCRLQGVQSNTTLRTLT